MTVCIAAICQEHGEPRILLCSDTQLSWGDYGSTNQTLKLELLGKGWVAQIGIRADSAGELINRIKEWFGRNNLVSDRAVLASLSGAMREFKKSPLCVPNCCQLLVSGFVGKDPKIFQIQYDDDRGELALNGCESFAAIGSGSMIAAVFLNSREYDRKLRIEDATYYVYEAKRFSEKADGVGAYTLLMFQAPQDSPMRDSEWSVNSGLRP